MSEFNDDESNKEKVLFYLSTPYMFVADMTNVDFKKLNILGKIILGPVLYLLGLVVLIPVFLFGLFVGLPVFSLCFVCGLFNLFCTRKNIENHSEKCGIINFIECRNVYINV